jgi:hypothetical protein
MTYKLHSLITFRGTLGAGAVTGEEWSIGIRVGDPIAPVTGLATNDRAQLIDAAFTTFIHSAGMNFSTHTAYTELRMYDIGVDNNAVTAPFIVLHEREQGSSGSSVHPYQCSVVATFVAPGLGPGRRGRVFLPPQSTAIQNDGTILDSVADAYATGVAGLLNTINTILAGDAICVISSGKGAGSLKPINQVRVGHVIDTHRSRRRSLDELYASSTASVA